MNINTILTEISRGREITSQELLILMKDKKHGEKIRTVADEINQKVNQDIVTFVHNRNVNFTNICQNHCMFCAFRKDKGDSRSYLLSVEQIIDRISKTPNITEVCIQGGIMPDIQFSYILGILEAIKEAYPDIHIHAFSPMEIKCFAEASGKSIGDVLDDLIKCGLDSVPGTAAEIFDDKVRKIICPQKLSAKEWQGIITTVHKKGLRSTATILIGHIESDVSIVDHLKRIRDIQRKTRGFTEFIPLIFVPFSTALGKNYGIDRILPISYMLKFYALLRLYFHKYIKNIQVSWPKLGFENALDCLSAGVNDMGGTLYEENITRSAGGWSGQMISLEEFQEGICRAGKTPKMRDTLYNFIKAS